MKHFYNNGKETKKFEEGTQPENWVLGRLGNFKKTKGNTGMRWYNNGKIQKQFFPNTQPVGWLLGMLPFSSTQLENLKIARNKRTDKPMLGKHHSEETKERIRQINLDKKYSAETNYKKGSGWRNKKRPAFSVEWRKNISKAQKGKKISIESYNKGIETKKKNGTLNYSKPEENLYGYLVKLFGKKDIIRQYKEERYPYFCDFYIKSKDLFIELNGNWNHGPHPFNNTDENDIDLLEQWQAKTNGKDYYSNAIYVWTELDVKKQQVAKENNLNYIMIYDYKDKENIENKLRLWHDVN